MNLLNPGKLCLIFLSKFLRVVMGISGSLTSDLVVGAARDYRLIIVSKCVARPELRIAPLDSSLNTWRQGKSYSYLLNSCWSSESDKPTLNGQVAAYCARWFPVGGLYPTSPVHRETQGDEELVPEVANPVGGRLPE